MSYDRQIDQVCPHFVAEESLFLDVDRKTIRSLRPISSIDSISVFLNHEIQIPSIGVALAGQTTGSKNGPFNITAGVNDTLVIAVGAGPLQTAVIPAANQLPAAQVAGLLDAAFNGVIVNAVGNKISIQTMAQGRGASFFLYASSTLAATLGLTTNHEYRGQQLVPGWTLVRDPTTLIDRPTRLIVFDAPLRGGSEFVELSYSTIQQECRRCGGSGVENDFRYSVNGEPVAVQDEALLIQELQKDFYTLLGSNPFHTWYGTQLLDTIGKKLTAGGFVQNLIVSDIYQAFQRWQDIKTQQEQTVQQFVSDAEFPFRLLSVDLQQSTQDPTVIFVNITVQNRSNDQLQLTRGLKVPLPTDLLGSTQQQGLVRQSLSNFVQSG